MLTNNKCDWQPLSSNRFDCKIANYILLNYYFFYEPDGHESVKLRGNQSILVPETARFKSRHGIFQRNLGPSHGLWGQVVSHAASAVDVQQDRQTLDFSQRGCFAPYLHPRGFAVVVAPPAGTERILHGGLAGERTLQPKQNYNYRDGVDEPSLAEGGQRGF